MVKFDKDTGKILQSELTSYRYSNGRWYGDGLGDYGYIWLRAVDSNGSPIYVKFDEDWAHWSCYYATYAMPVGSEKKAA